MWIKGLMVDGKKLFLNVEIIILGLCIIIPVVDENVAMVVWVFDIWCHAEPPAHHFKGEVFNILDELCDAHHFL